MKPYDPYNWYWIVGGDMSRAFSSGLLPAPDYVPADEATFVAWQSDGTLPTNILNENELGEVLSQYSIRPASLPVLDAYKDHQAKFLTKEVVAKALFFMANEIRVLQNKNPVTPQQFRGWLKDLM